ncbi:MAG: glycosyltransferase [Planctomycetota bacterium]|jgi:glycosyltransferase involved in cell wall biosynthesis
MRVVQVIEALTRGGAERLVIELARELADRGLYSRVLCLSDDGEWAGGLAARGLYAGCVGKRRGPDFPCALRLRAALDALGADVVNAHLFTANLWTRLAGIKGRRWSLVATLHNVDNWRGPIHRVADQALWWAADAYVAVSDTVASYYSGQGVPSSRLSVIRNGIHWNGQICPTPLEGDTPVIRACGRLVPQKGFETLIDAAFILAQSRDFVLEIVGDGPERMKLEEAVQARGLDGTVIFLGARDDARRLIASCDLFVLASLREGLPLVLLEALHAGRPVVATRLSAITGVVRDGREARLAETGSAISLAAAIDAMLSDVATARTMAQRGREMARREFSMERVASDYLELYGTLQGRRR